MNLQKSHAVNLSGNNLEIANSGSSREVEVVRGAPASTPPQTHEATALRFFFIYGVCPILQRCVVQATVAFVVTFGLSATQGAEPPLQPPSRSAGAAPAAGTKPHATGPYNGIATAHIKWALAQIETGAAAEGPSPEDHLRGRSHEISRYQILPAVWRSYTKRRDYWNPSTSWKVTEKILADRVRWFRSRALREPTPFDLYVLWNAPGQYKSVGFVRGRVPAVIADRGSRFANLVDSAARRAGP